MISDWRSRTSLVPTWITIRLNLRLALASTFKFAKMVAGVSILTFRTIESPITRAFSSGFSVGVSLSGENLFNDLIGTEEQCFDPWLCRLTVTQLPCCTGSSGTEQCTGLPELVTSKAVSTALTFLLSSTKVWMRVSSSKIFSVSLTISLHLSHVNVENRSAENNSRRIRHYSPWLKNDSNLTYHLPLTTVYHCCLVNLWKTEREQNETER